MSAHPPIFRTGDVLNNTYRIEAILGRGGTSEVYRARSEISGKVVALKALRSEFARNDDYLALMTREEDIRDIRHDVIVRYFDTQRTDDGTVYLVMDYIDGPALDKKMREGGMAAADLMVVAARVLEGLHAAHSRNIVHRDLSPDNIILRGGDPKQAVIIDFGIAKDTNPGAQTIVGGEFAGKYAYAAPEQLAGKADARTDLYSLGALLLAVFRGKAPDSGANLMEVVERKAKPPDTSGVPEPLRSLIARLTDPDREKRFPSAEAALAAIRSGALAPAPAEGEATVIVPRKATTPPPAPKRTPPAPPAAAAKKGGKGGLIAAMLAVLALGLGGAEYATGALGLFGPSLPLEKPFTLSVTRDEGAAPVAAGFVPDQEVATRLSAAIAEQGGAAPELPLARGDIAETWGEGVVDLVGRLASLPEYRLLVADNQVQVEGITSIRSDYEQAKADLATMPPGLTGSAVIELGPRILGLRAVQPVLAAHEDCGPLTVINAPAQGWGLGATIQVSGRIASAENQAKLREALEAVIGNRVAQLDLEVLNPTLCLLDAALPTAFGGGLNFAFGYGDRDEPNPQARYLVGENPVIDLTVPADVPEGYLYVSALDVSGNIFHLIPNVQRADNRLSDLRAGRNGPVTVRLAYGIEEAKGTGRIAFAVDDSALGKTRLVAIVSDAPLFGGLRPITESAESYAKALGELTTPIRSLDSAVLTTAKP